jgi:two-component system, NtrC family, response regulator AtoC
MTHGSTSDRLSVTLTDEPTPAAPPLARHYLLVFERGGSWVFELPRAGKIVIGRGELAELRLREHAISRRHAVLAVADDRVVLRDLGSHNGTSVNGERIAAERELCNGDSVAVCAATLVLYTSAPATPVARWLSYRELRERVEEELERALRHQRPAAVMCGLLAHAGDRDAVDRALLAPREPALEALGELGARLGAWADDTQLVLLAPETDRDEADAMARRIRERLRDLEITIGYAVCPLDGGDADSLIIAAKAAAASTTAGEVAGAATALRTYRIGDRNAIVADPAMARLYALVERLARVDLPVLITGETGTGKELAATLLHERSPRHDKPLVALNCAAIQENLVESELFGYERGAFSGALTTKIGLLEAAHGGTVFLDEIGELPLAIQAKLLRVLETKRLTRVGDLREREINVRLVAATNCDLPDEVDAGRFRRDLFFRLSGAMVVVPPLRERTRELPLLAELFLTEACRAVNRPAITLSSDALTALHAHRWPGNVRELKNVMEYFAATLSGGRLVAAQLAERLAPSPARAAAPAGEPPGPAAFVPISDEIRALESLRMTQALEAADGNQTRAAELIAMPLRTFFTKMRQYGLRK